eukprot:gene34280-biopygen3340
MFPSSSRIKRKFPDQAKTSLDSELSQLLKKGVFEAIHPDDLSPEERARRIPSFAFLKKKYDAQGNFDKIKTRLVAGGHRQDKDLYPDISSPTASTTAVMVVCALAAREGREVITMDIAGAYLNADMADIQTHMLLDSTISSLVVDLDPRFIPFLDSKGRLTVLLKKALYGCVESAKLWFEHLSRSLSRLGYETNPKEECIFNRMDSGLQTTVVVYVDDLLITCEDSDMLERAAAEIQDIYKDVTMHRGKVHSYLGIT